MNGERTRFLLLGRSLLFQGHEILDVLHPQQELISSFDHHIQELYHYEYVSHVPMTKITRTRFTTNIVNEISYRRCRCRIMIEIVFIIIIG